MKLGEALNEKAKLKRKLADLQSRMTQCLFRTKIGTDVIQTPEDSYEDLDRQFVDAVNAYHDLNRRIQITNANSKTLEVMSRIAVASATAKALETVLASCGAGSSYGFHRTKEDSYLECVVSAKDLRERISNLKDLILELNSQLNGLNWSIELE